MRRINKGLIIAFVGIDGSGKSSTIKALRRENFPTTKGTKVIYFGNNHFWIPGLQSMYSKQHLKKRGFWAACLKGWASIDIKFRCIPAIMAQRSGKLVFCDRYYYDQQIGDPVRNFTKNRLLRKLANPFIRWMPVRPDLVFFLRVSPSIALKRKDNLHKETLDRVAQMYDKLLQEDRPEQVNIIDASQELRTVVAAITQVIKLKLKQKNETEN